MKRYLLFVLLAFSSPSILFSAAAALAQCTSTITVSSYNDSGPGTLRDALAKICSPGEIDIPAPGTNSIPPGAKITLSTVGDYTFGPSALAIASAQIVTIKALGNGVIIQRDATVANLRLFYVVQTATLTLKNVTLQGGKAQGGKGGGQAGDTQGSGGGGAAGLGGAIFNEGTLTLNGVTLSGNTAQGGAGGASNGGGLAGGGGGGLGGNGGAGIFAGGGGGGNQGDGGNGGFCNGGHASGGVTTGGDGGEGCTTQSGASGGNGGGGGGGAYGNSYSPGFDGSGGNGGFGAGGGGGTGGRGSIGLGSGGPGGFGGGGGGGKSGVASGGFGGGNGGNCGSNFNGFCGGDGGGGAGLGGGIFNSTGGTLTLVNSTFAANTATGGAAGGSSATGGSGVGGAIFNQNGGVTIDNVTIGPAGGDIYNYYDGTPNQAATVALTNTILDSVPQGVNCTNNNGTIADGGHNLENGTSCGFASASNDPKLQPLADNGGPTQTIALGANSPAINAGDSSVCSNAPVNGIDQRGLPRRSGFCDIGAFEVQPAKISVYSGSPQSANVNTAFALPLKALVVDGSSDPLGGVAVSYTAPGSGASATLSSGSATTDGTGIASVTATANGSPGSYNVVAKDPLAHTVNFQLTNRPPIQATVSPASINFGDVQVDTRVQKIITLKNTGGAPLVISKIELVNAGGPPDFATVFTLTNNCPSSLPAGKSCKITVTLFDNQPETLSTSVDITDNAADSPQHVPLSANVTEVDIGFKPASLSFAPIAVGSPGKKTATITNLSNATMTLNSIVFTGTNASDFSQTNNCPAPLQPNASCKAVVTFTPGGTGSRVAGMMVTANGGTTIQTLPLSGTGN